MRDAHGVYALLLVCVQYVCVFVCTRVCLFACARCMFACARCDHVVCTHVRSDMRAGARACIFSVSARACMRAFARTRGLNAVPLE